MKIGVTGPFTGRRKVFGDLIKSATKEIMEELKPLEQIDFVFKDDKATVVNALEVANAFVEEGVEAVIGHFNSSCARETAKIYHQSKITFVAPASTLLNIPHESMGFVHRTCPNNLDQVKLVLDYCKNNNIVKLGVFSDYTNYANELFLLASQVAEQVKILPVQEFADCNDLDAVLFLGTHFYCMETAAKLLNDLGFDRPMFFCDDCFIGEFVDHFPVKHEHMFVVGLENGGYKRIFSNSLETLIHSLQNSREFHYEKENWKLFKINEVWKHLT